MYKLSRNFLISSALGLILVTALLGYQYQQTVLDNLIQQKIFENTTIAKLLGNNLWEEFSPHVVELSGLSHDELALHFAVREFDSSVRTRTVDLDILQVNIYALNGNTIFSTEPQVLGTNSQNLPEFQLAKSGKTATDVKYVALANAMRRTRVNRTITISFLPLYEADEHQINAVMEIHTDITKQLSSLDASQNQAYLFIAGSLLVLLGILYGTVRRADTQLKQHALRIDLQQQQIEHQTYHDVLTGLPNRNLFRDRLRHAIELADSRELLVAILVVNLDRFKQVNDTFGHAIGDRLLLEVVSRLKNCLRSGDTLARSCGDEFYIILEAVSVIYEAEEVAGLILDEFASSVAIEEHELYVTPSIGMVIYPFADDEIDILIKKASTAMHQAKDAGHTTYQLYDPSTVRFTVSRFSLENSMRSALERNEFELHYQPLVHLKTGEIISVEALIRWRSPTLGLVSPLEFVPLLEETGLIMPVGEWILETACKQTVAWQQLGIKNLRVNVNLSAIQFQQKGITRQVRNALDQSGLKSHLLDLEITESLLIDDMTNTMPVLDALNDMGVALSIDDFGTGYSSLAYLKRMPIETLKIDRSFVRDITTDVNDAAIVDAICAMANSLRFKVTAEGVETLDQLNFLSQRKVDTVQGFLFSRPLPATEATNVLRNSNTLIPKRKIA